MSERLAIRYVRPVDVVVTDASSFCLCGFLASARGLYAHAEVKAKFDAHRCPFQTAENSDDQA